MDALESPRLDFFPVAAPVNSSPADTSTSVTVPNGDFAQALAQAPIIPATDDAAAVVVAPEVIPAAATLTATIAEAASAELLAEWTSAIPVVTTFQPIVVDADIPVDDTLPVQDTSISAIAPDVAEPVPVVPTVSAHTLPTVLATTFIQPPKTEPKLHHHSFKVPPTVPVTEATGTEISSFVVNTVVTPFQVAPCVAAPTAITPGESNAAPVEDATSDGPVALPSVKTSEPVINTPVMVPFVVYTIPQPPLALIAPTTQPVANGTPAVAVAIIGPVTQPLASTSAETAVPSAALVLKTPTVEAHAAVKPISTPVPVATQQIPLPQPAVHETVAQNAATSHVVAAQMARPVVNAAPIVNNDQRPEDAAGTPAPVVSKNVDLPTPPASSAARIPVASTPAPRQHVVPPVQPAAHAVPHTNPVTPTVPVAVRPTAPPVIHQSVVSVAQRTAPTQTPVEASLPPTVVPQTAAPTAAVVPVLSPAAVTVPPEAFVSASVPVVKTADDEPSPEPAPVVASQPVLPAATVARNPVPDVVPTVAAADTAPAPMVPRQPHTSLQRSGDDRTTPVAQPHDATSINTPAVQVTVGTEIPIEEPLRGDAVPMVHRVDPVRMESSALDFGTPVPIQHTEHLMQRLSDAIGFARDSGQHLSIRVSPPQFGPIVVEVRMHEGGMTARVETHSTLAQQAITEHLPQLHESLATRGATLERIEIVPIANRTEDRSASADRVSSERESTSNAWVSTGTSGRQGADPQDTNRRRQPRPQPQPTVDTPADVAPVTAGRPMELQALNVRV